MNDEFLAKLRNKALQFETEKALVEQIYESVWNEVMDQYEADYLKEEEMLKSEYDYDSYKSDNIYTIISGYDAEGKRNNNGSYELFKRLSSDGFNNHQMPGEIYFTISREKIEKIINANKENKKGGKSK